MRRVFPLRHAENSSCDEAEEKACSKPYNEDLNVQDLRKQPDDAKAVTSDKLMPKLVSSCDSSVASGDENLPGANNVVTKEEAIVITKETAIARSTSNEKPPRASAYPVFTAGASHRFSSPRLAIPFDKSRQKILAEKQRLAPLFSQQFNDFQTKPLKQASLDKSRSQFERPLCAPNNRRQSDASQGNCLRTTSLRAMHLPDTIMVSYEGDRGSCNAVSDQELAISPSINARSLTQAPSERSYSESSDVSSCFTKVSETSSSRTFDSGSPSSKKGLSGRPPGSGNSPFKYLSARMVAEKLVKVLGREKTCSLSSRPIATEHEHDTLSQTSVKHCYDAESSIPSECKVKHEQKNSGLLVSDHDPFLQKDMHTSGDPDASRRFTIVNQRSEDVSMGTLHSLEARALMREEMARNLEDDSSWEGEHSSTCASEYPEEVNTQDCDALKEEISKLRLEKRDLALEVAGEIRMRISEKRRAAVELKHLKSEMQAKVSAVEREKYTLQESLEKEIERRGEEWNDKLEKIQREERKMRERVKEIAEDRVELQKVVSLFKERESCWKDETKSLECLVSTLKQGLKDSETELTRQIQASANNSKKLKVSDCEIENLVQRNSSLELESSELQKEVTRLRRVCNDQETTIEGLWQQLDEAVNGTFECKSENLLRLQRELLRLAGVEQGLRSEINALYVELSAVKQDRGIADVEVPADLVKLNQELQERVDKLQTKMVSLQNHNKKLSLGLHAAVSGRRDAERTLKLWQSRQEEEIEQWSQKDVKASEMLADIEGASSAAHKEESGCMLNEEDMKVLHSKLQSREAELEELNEEINEIISTRDSLQVEVDDLQMEVDDLHEKLLVANQRTRELERQVKDKEEIIETLRADLVERDTELTSLQNELPCIRMQRDEMHKEAEDMSKEAFRLAVELSEVKRVAERLEEEVMLKEGQISILRGTYTNSDYLA